MLDITTTVCLYQSSAIQQLLSYESCRKWNRFLILACEIPVCLYMRKERQNAYILKRRCMTQSQVPWLYVLDHASKIYQSSHVITLNHCASSDTYGYTKTLAWAHAAFHPPINHIRLHLFIWNCFGSDTNQCTSQVNPGEIEILLQTSDHNQTAQRRVYLGFKNTGPRHNGGQPLKGKQRRLHLRHCRLLRGRCWWCSGKNTWGWIQRTNTDWQRLVCGLG